MVSIVQGDQPRKLDRLRMWEGEKLEPNRAGVAPCEVRHLTAHDDPHGVTTTEKGRKPMETELRRGLAVRLEPILDTRLRVDVGTVLEVLETWLHDSGLSIVDENLEIVEL